ncbi:MAG: hypothetical protein Q7R33_03200, partial [Nitrosarchaeum sp.]|nr:hypothetical protein [Nitrosarchaeum sp.]
SPEYDLVKLDKFQNAHDAIKQALDKVGYQLVQGRIDHFDENMKTIGDRVAKFQKKYATRDIYSPQIFSLRLWNKKYTPTDAHRIVAQYEKHKAVLTAMRDQVQKVKRLDADLHVESYLFGEQERLLNRLQKQVNHVKPDDVALIQSHYLHAPIHTSIDQPESISAQFANQLARVAHDPSTPLIGRLSEIVNFMTPRQKQEALKKWENRIKDVRRINSAQLHNENLDDVLSKLYESLYREVRAVA